MCSVFLEFWVVVAIASLLFSTIGLIYAKVTKGKGSEIAIAGIIVIAFIIFHSILSSIVGLDIYFKYNF